MPGEWHNRMEKQFPDNMREVKFYCSSRESNTCRRADILLDKNRTCEIQHSYISENEIVNRSNDWNIFGKDIIWLIDGNEGIKLDKLSTGNYLLIFKQVWKYKSFIKTYDFILIEKDNFIFKIELNKIRSAMIEIKEPKTLQETIEHLKTKPVEIWDFWSDENVVKSTLGVYQQGAGNGKTYGIWKSITENVDRKTYIIVTKQHSAKTVIYEELKDQKGRFKNGEEVYHIENLTDDTEENTEKHYVINYTHKKSGRECKVIIGTIDSFCYNLSHSNAKGSNFFEGIIDNIKEKGATKINNGQMKFGGQYIQLSRESEIWIDEVQDLPENYLHAMLKLMYETSCYMNVVGDKLQSLEFSNNFLTRIVGEGLPNINIDKKDAINKNRRIKVTNMSEKINELIHFNDYKYKGKDLPEIQCDEIIKKTINDDPIKIIESPLIYANDTDNVGVDNYCDKIMEYYINEVENNGYFPNDFLIIFPIMKGNVIAPELQTKIQGYWLGKETSDNDNYTQYVYLHRHTEGTVINTKDSVNATRIMSIKSSKGDGRKVVFILGVTEGSLKIASNKEEGLVYESHLHVALTRAKNQIYFGLIKNNDDIHQRFGETGYVDYLPTISKNINLDKITGLINKDKLIDLIQGHDVNLTNILKEESSIKQSETIDWGYHCIKYQTCYYQVILNIVNGKDINTYGRTDQLFVKLRRISNYGIIHYNVKDFYKFLTLYQYKVIPHFPLCKLSDKHEYQKYYSIIKTAIIKVQKSISSNKLDELNVYESIILTYMIQVETSQKHADMTPMDIYNITDCFQNTNKESELLNNVKNVKNIIGEAGIQNYQNIQWNIFKHIELNSNKEKDYFKISKLQFPIIGNNESDIIHIVLKSDMNKLNFWDIMIEVLLERFLIYNPKSDADVGKFHDKKINTFIFLLDKNDFIKIDWDWDKGLIKEIKTELKLALQGYYESNHDDIYKYLDFIKNNRKELWDDNPYEIIEEITNKCEGTEGTDNFPEYIIEVFKDIGTKIEDEENYDYVNDNVKFNNKLNIKLQKHLKKYLQL
jgi:hypothetical protein